jgi:hypothetical protein
MIKIGFIGAGTASSIGLLALFHKIQSYNFTDIETTLIHNPQIPITHVGEGGSVMLTNILKDVLEFDYRTDCDDIDATLKWGGKYFWEEASGNNFNVRYGSVPALHFNSQKFSAWAIEKITSKFKNHSNIEDNILDIKQDNATVKLIGENQNYTFDYVIDCRGTPTAEELASDLYDVPEFVGVNSVILYQDLSNYNENYTSAYVHDNGWMFGIPLTFRKAFGYCYNNQITSEEEAIEKFSKLKNIDASQCRRFSWKQYYRKQVIDNRVLFLGNKLYFFEPHQALPLHYYAIMMYTFVDYILLGTNTNEELNQFHIDSMLTVQNLIAINYAGKNSINSKFWNQIQPLAIQKLKNSPEFNQWAELSYKKMNYEKYWTLNSTIMKSYFKGYDIDIKDFL